MNWPMMKLGEICEVVGGGTPKTGTPEYWDGDIPWITPRDLSSHQELFISKGSRSISQAGLEKSSAQLLPAGTVLWSSRAPIGHVAIASNEIATNQGFKSFVPGPKVDSQYLAQALRFMKEPLQELGTGATFKEVSAKRAREISIPLPPLEEQKRIAAILGSSKSVRAASETQVVKARELKSEYFRMLISDPSNISTHDDLLNVVDSIFDCPHSTPKWADFGIPCIWTNNVRERYFNWDAPRYVDEETFHLRSTRAYLKPGDIVLSREGTVGVAAVIPSGFMGCMGQRLVQVRPSTDGLPTPWILESLLYLLSPTRISRFMVGATSKHLNVRDLKKLQIPIPTDEALKQFIEFDARTSDLALRLKAREDAVEELHQSLATRAFAGRL